MSTSERLSPTQLLVGSAVGLVILIASASVTWLWQSERDLSKKDAIKPAAMRGQALYQVYCAHCHGPEGHGDGTVAAQLKPPPRDFALASAWKFGISSTAIRRVITQGIPGTAMPALGQSLSSADLDALVAHIRTLAPNPASPTSPISAELETAVRLSGFVPEPYLRPAARLDLRAAATGKEVYLGSLEGKWVLLTFWGTNCPHCLKHFPKLAELAQYIEAKGGMVVAVCADETEAETVEAAARHISKLPVYVDPNHLTATRYEVQTLPTHFLLDAQGRLLGHADGAVDWSNEGIRSLCDRMPKGR